MNSPIQTRSRSIVARTNRVCEMHLVLYILRNATIIVFQLIHILFSDISCIIFCTLTIDRECL